MRNYLAVLILVAAISSVKKVFAQDRENVNSIPSIFAAIGVLFLDYGFPTKYWTTPEIVRRDGYIIEIHKIFTADDYELTLHRIPPKNSSAKPIFLQHGVLVSSSCWVINGKNSLAYILHHLGYDVWMGNIRGNTYSRGHKNLSPYSQKFWNFSYHEMGMYDIPASINYVYGQTNSSMIYIGHSMGTTIFYIAASQYPEIASKVQAMFSFAPVAFLNNMYSPPLRKLVPYQGLLYKILGDGPYFPELTVWRFVTYHLCVNDKLKEFFSRSWQRFLGYHRFNYSLTPRIINAVPGGVSTKTFLHYSQLVSRPDKFRQFDYGKVKNLQVYRDPNPPPYDLKNIRVPISLFSASNDWISNVTDVETLGKLLPVKLPGHHVREPLFNHVDYLWGDDVTNLVYKPMLDIIGEFLYKVKN